MRIFLVLFCVFLFIASSRASLPKQTSFIGVQAVKHFEGFMVCRYVDIAGYDTIGYGHKIENNLLPECINPHIGHELLVIDLKEAEQCIDKKVQVPLTQNQFDALVSFVFNLGCGNFSRSTLLKKINKKEYIDASNEFIRWNKARINGNLKPVRGLTLRRKLESYLFRN